MYLIHNPAFWFCLIVFNAFCLLFLGGREQSKELYYGLGGLALIINSLMLGITLAKLDMI
jgi:hypothetical protein